MYNRFKYNQSEYNSEPIVINVSVSASTLNIVSTVTAPNIITTKNAVITPAVLNLNLTSFNPSIIVALDSVVTVSSLDISSVAQVPQIIVPLSLPINATATGSGVRKKRNSYRIQKAYNIDGLKGFSRLRQFIIFGKILNVINNYFDISSGYFRSIDFDFNISGLITSLIKNNIYLAGLKQTNRLHNFGMKAKKCFVDSNSFSVGASRAIKDSSNWNISAQKTFNRVSSYNLKAITKQNIKEEKVISGKRNIIAILTALELVNA